MQAYMPGLSGVVDAQLGRPLDKAQQCSSWHLRPLTQEQVGSSPRSCQRCGSERIASNTHI